MQVINILAILIIFSLIFRRSAKVHEDLLRFGLRSYMHAGFFGRQKIIFQKDRKIFWAAIVFIVLVVVTAISY